MNRFVLHERMRVLFQKNSFERNLCGKQSLVVRMGLLDKSTLKNLKRVTNHEDANKREFMFRIINLFDGLHALLVLVANSKF